MSVLVKILKEESSLSTLTALVEMLYPHEALQCCRQVRVLTRRGPTLRLRFGIVSAVKISSIHDFMKRCGGSARTAAQHN